MPALKTLLLFLVGENGNKQCCAAPSDMVAILLLHVVEALGAVFMIPLSRVRFNEA